VTVIWTSECATCSYQPPTGEQLPQICTRCRGRLRANLADLPALYHRLGAVMQPGSGGGEKVSGTRTPPLPVRIGPFDLRGPAAPGEAVRDPYGDQHGEPALVAVLLSWEAWIRQDLHYTALPFRGTTEQTITASVDWITRQLDKICDEFAAADGFADAVHHLRLRCQREAGEAPDLRYIGDCPTLFDDGTACGKRLHAEANADSIDCRGCRTKRPRTEWLLLGRILRTQDGAA
jgi:hypothetical protein